jgi:hypothetical protein
MRGDPVGSDYDWPFGVLIWRSRTLRAIPNPSGLVAAETYLVSKLLLIGLAVDVPVYRCIPAVVELPDIPLI